MGMIEGYSMNVLNGPIISLVEGRGIILNKVIRFIKEGVNTKLNRTKGSFEGFEEA